MNKKLKRLWCASLRGDTWKQIKGQYHDDAQGRCALGVLLSLTNWKEEGLDTFYGKIKLDPMIRHQVAGMNDKGVSFLEIADWIEKNL